MTELEIELKKNLLDLDYQRNLQVKSNSLSLLGGFVFGVITTLIGIYLSNIPLRLNFQSPTLIFIVVLSAVICGFTFSSYKKSINELREIRSSIIDLSNLAKSKNQKK